MSTDESGSTGGRSPTDIFIERPVLAAVISVLILLLGAMGFSLLGVRETPDVESPIVSVSTSWPGADPAIMETDVTEVLERELNGIEGVRTMSSTSQDGRSEIRIEFDLGLDIEAAANDVRGRVGQARRRLPDDVEEPIVLKSDSSGDSIMFVRLAGEGHDLLDVTDVADTIVRERIENVPGVGGVDLNGARIWAMRLELDAARLAARQVTVEDIEAALRAGNVDVPAGRLEGAATQLTLSVRSGLRTPEDFGALIVRSAGSSGSGQVYLRDVASVRLGAEDERSSARVEGMPTVTLSVNPQAKANVVDVSDEVKRRLSLIEADLPAGMTLDVVYDRAEAVRHSIHDVQLTLAVAFTLVVTVIFVFLRDLRSTLVPAVAIPVSLVGTFLVLWMAGFTINVFTLFGLVLAIGLVVDDAIVVLENIVRRIEEGEAPTRAALLGTRQIAGAVVATTLSLVVVFLPVVFTGGATGRLFLEFGITVAASVALSMVVALTLTPMLCALLLKPAAHGTSAASRREPLWERVFNSSLGLVMRRPLLVVPMLFGAIAIGGWGVASTPTEFFPIEDRGMFIVRTEAPEGTTFEWMDARMIEFEKLMEPLVPERRMMLSRVATGRGGVSGATNSGRILFPLVPRGERDRTQQEIVDALRGPLAEITAFRAVPTQSPTIGRGSSSPVQFVLQHPDFDTLADQLPAFVAAMTDLPGLSSVNPDLKLNRPELRLVVDREKAAALGISIREVVRTIQVLTGSAEVSKFKRGVRQYNVIAELRKSSRDEPADLGGIHLRTTSGDMVALSNFVRWEEQSAPSTRYHYDRAPSATISANLEGITLGQALARVRTLADTLPEGFRTALAGQSKDFEEGSSSLLQMFLLALALVYLLLSAQFDSFVAPISILLSVPLALAGAFTALFVAGETLSFFAQVGLILLIGLVTKNGILIVEYARQLREHDGLSPWAAAEQATRLRVRPILMTSVATIGGAIPIALGVSGASRAALGIAVVGGMLSATLLTLYVTPVVYAALASIGKPRA